MFKVSPDNAVRMDLVSETVNSQCNIEFWFLTGVVTNSTHFYWPIL
jgi:hypothetical protein